MPKNLMIVESPSKAKTIKSYLGDDFDVIATVGHIIDLPTSKLGVDVEHNYDIDYTVIKGKDKVIKDLQKAVKNTKGMVFLSPDPDREGESIAWQIVKVCDLPEDHYKRVVFHEVTKEAIKDAIKEPRLINFDLVEAQQGRRILDRLVGYPLSQLLWKKIKYGLSAGRVQSVALRLIAERENEIKNFVPEPYFVFDVTYKETGKDLVFRLSEKGGEIFKATPDFIKQYGDKVLSDGKHSVLKYIEKERFESPSAPFTTSMLQQAANKRFGFTAKMTMSVAQELYQGVSIGEKGLQGLITYMRTDSNHMSESAVQNIRGFITSTYGEQYLHETVRRYKTKSKVAQEAHEAIRPTHVEFTPESLSSFLTPQQFRLYSLIWTRAVSTQMKQAVVLEKTLYTTSQDKEVAGIFEKEGLSYQVSSEEIVFKGFRLLEKESEKKIPKIPKMEIGTPLTIDVLQKQDLMTTPRNRYNDASLVKEMEKKGIGRPSTYASIITTLVNRGYVERDEKFLSPTDIGMLVAQFLMQYFPGIVDYNFTAAMENQLDQIVNEHLDKKKMLDAFYPGFIKEIEEKDKTIKKETLTDLGESDRDCPKCGRKLHLKIGPYGKYYHCINDECKYSEPFLDRNKYFIPPEVEKEGFVLKKSRFGMFWSHPDYPKVKKILPLLLKDICPKCGTHHLVERTTKFGRKFIGCSGYPDCDYIANPTRRFSRTAKASTTTEKSTTAAKTKTAKATKKPAKKAVKKTTSRKNASTKTTRKK